jgi:hypothetical protein
MSRNRMKNSQSLHWMGVVKWVLIAGLLSMLGLCYMYCKNQNLQLAESTHRLELQLGAIQKRNYELMGQLETMKSPQRLQRRLAQMHSDLVRLGDGGVMVVHMEEATRMRLAHIGTVPQVGNLDPAVVVSSAGTSGISTQPPQ